MTIPIPEPVPGIQTDVNQLSQMAGALAVTAKNNSRAIIDLNNYIVSLGGAAFLVGRGMDPTVAATTVSSLGNLANWCGIFANQPSTQSLPFNFLENARPLYGGN
jgi:hypothetical protein